ncbi:Mitochondrial genome maintenance protein [Friedmanniomyces endolithicus]|uniref:Mitochondrial genome maintenance protein MGM101 n=1 Tax=Friedmanniomyces endolithicus TaxID=329885 RepID=A0A4U0VJZ3_9PEZI|nr:Mitochondrial genome maintenance protein [Friedmanniomyces endolithicus]
MSVEENAGLNNCFFEKKDWRACKDEVSGVMKTDTYRLSANAYHVHRNVHRVTRNHGSRTLFANPPPVLGENEKQVDWTRSYHGLSSTPFTTEQAAILQQEIKFDDIEIKPDGIIYLPEIKYRRILNKAFRPGGWGLVPRGETIVTGKLVTREYGLVCGGR